MPARHSADSSRTALPRASAVSLPVTEEVAAPLALPADVRVTLRRRPDTASSRPSSPSLDPPNVTRPLIAIVVPVFNERDNLRPFYDEVTDVMRSLADYDWEFVFVDDGSRDGSFAVLNGLRAARRAGTGAALSPQLRQPRRHRRRHRLLPGDAVVVHGRRPPGSAGAHPRLRRALARGLRRRLGRENRARRWRGARRGRCDRFYAPRAAVRHSDVSQGWHGQLLPDFDAP